MILRKFWVMSKRQYWFMAVVAVVWLIIVAFQLHIRARYDPLSSLDGVVYLNRPDRIAPLLRSGADVNQRFQLGDTALILAASLGHMQVLQALLEQGADVNLRNQLGMTALYAAASEGHLDCVRLLLAHGADTRIQTNEGRTALETAQAKGQIQIVEMLKAAEYDQ